MAVIGVNEGTVKFVNFDLNGTVNTQVVGVGYGTINTLGTLPNLPQGSIQVTAGTGIITGGSIVVTNGTIATGSIVVTAGTVAAHAITAATITEGTLRNLISGTINSATCVLGTLPGVGTVTGLGTCTTVTTVSNLTNGSIKITNGTVDNVLEVNMVDEINTLDIVDIIHAGTIKLDGRVAKNVLTYGTTFAGTAAAYATIVGSASVGAGTYIWVNDVSVNNPNNNITCVVGFGTALNGTSILLKGVFGTTAGVGQQKSFNNPVNAGMTNQDLVAYISGAGTIDVNVSYFISA